MKHFPGNTDEKFLYGILALFASVPVLVFSGTPPFADDSGGEIRVIPMDADGSPVWHRRTLQKQCKNCTKRLFRISHQIQ